MRMYAIPAIYLYHAIMAENRDRAPSTSSNIDRIAGAVVEAVRRSLNDTLSPDQSSIGVTADRQGIAVIITLIFRLCYYAYIRSPDRLLLMFCSFLL